MRLEEDSFGSIKVPSDAYYGPFTQRSMDNFHISGTYFQKEFIHAYAILKRSAAIANERLGALDPRISRAIVRACDEIINGKFGDQFRVDVFQAGTGTSTNMNLNEVIANRALEILGHKRGNYRVVNPNDHVNMSQSTNDTFQSAAHIAACLMIKKRLVPALEKYQKSIEKKSGEFSGIVKSGRTHLMDAVPITLGQEFSGYTIEQEMKEIREASDDLLHLSVGGTAVGTGLNTYPKYKSLFFSELNRYTKSRFVPVKNNFAMTQNITTIAETSSKLRNLCLKLIKTSNDLRLMSSGPYAGLNEIALPAVQAGSSIMPGKVNPSMPEMLTMVCFSVMGNDSTIAIAAQGGQFELNIFVPVAAYKLLESIGILSKGIEVFTERCISGIRPNRAQLRGYFERSAEVATALSPALGYERVAMLVKEAERRDLSIRDLVLEKRLIGKKELDRILDPARLTRPDLPFSKAGKKRA
ncbi:MAG: aspartate ammonia-lyase [Candidatus Micrarchaeota archaeon]|nr:aspartate ammonia-lyase [Candidatus Micrarchaeota archaeon]